MLTGSAHVDTASKARVPRKKRFGVCMSALMTLWRLGANKGERY